ncbi:MAG: PilW family protein [Myxococcota bacterium]|jgi:prepilin-type N-terminal cleavage/methylation domain-containing protein|nr:PilW family protein [Myxococcota bacterium]
MQLMRKKLRAQEKGFTLVELMLTVGLGSIVAGAIVGTMVTQQQGYQTALEFTEAQQNVRAALDVINYYARQAGRGFVVAGNGTGSSAVTLAGSPFIGNCFLGKSHSGKGLGAAQDNCDNIDTDVDRLRIAYADADRIYDDAAYDLAIDTAEGTIQICCNGSGSELCHDSTSVGALHSSSETISSSAPVYGLISGTCSDGNLANDLVLLTKVSNCSNLTSGYNAYVYNSDLSGQSSSTTLSCTYATGAFKLSRAEVVDFFVDKTTDSLHPTLKMNRQSAVGESSAQIIAYDVEDIQFQYGIDTSKNPDGILGDGGTPIWCDDLYITADSVGDDDCAGLGTFGTTLAYQQRAIALRLAVIVRTRHQRSRLMKHDVSAYDGATYPLSSENNVRGHYRRWIFRSTIGLRNNAL